MVAGATDHLGDFGEWVKERLGPFGDFYHDFHFHIVSSSVRQNRPNMNPVIIWRKVLNGLTVDFFFLYNPDQLSVSRLDDFKHFTFLALARNFFLELDRHDIAIEREAKGFALDHNVFVEPFVRYKASALTADHNRSFNSLFHGSHTSIDDLKNPLYFHS